MAYASLIPTLWEAEAGGKWEFCGRLLQASGKPELHIKTCFKKKKIRNRNRGPRLREAKVTCPQPPSWNAQELLLCGLKEQALATEQYLPILPQPNPPQLPRTAKITLFPSWSVGLYGWNLHLEMNVFMPGRGGH